MRLPDSQNVRAFPRVLVTIFLAAGLAACSSSRDADLAVAAGAPANGPQADYPITVGDPYSVEGLTYTPADVLNYDEVGYLALDEEAMGYTGAHHTLPVPSYAEVTSLETGRTVLVRLERRGPMASNHLLALSPAAMAQLEATAETPVRVRRVNPPEEQRAMLRGGNAAPMRMDTPMSLVTVLRRRLPPTGSASLQAQAEVPQSPEDTEAAHSIETIDIAASTAERAPAETSVELPPMTDATEAETSPPAIENGYVVQAAAFSNPDNARRAANALGGEVSRFGEYYRVRTGPFATRGEAEASLANVRRAGYSDARILTSG